MTHSFPTRRSSDLLGMGGTAAIALIVSVAFILRGLWPVAIYGAIEILLIAAAAWSFARHVRDGETVTLLTDGRMIIDVQAGDATTRHVFNRNWTRLVNQPEHGRAYVSSPVHNAPLVIRSHLENKKIEHTQKAQ